jgi:hypothetical protein
MNLLLFFQNKEIGLKSGHVDTLLFYDYPTLEAQEGTVVDRFSSLVLLV